jgi:hypothetical protein
VKEKFNDLIDSTNGNFTVLIWLGIIDLKKFADFIVNDDIFRQKLDQQQSIINKSKLAY